MVSDRFRYADVSTDRAARSAVDVDAARMREIPLEHVGRSFAQMSDTARYVADVWRTPQRDTYVELSKLGFASVECCTLLEDGTVITTSTPPPLRYARTLRVLLRNPRLRTFHGVCFTRSIERLVRRHRDRVARVAARRKSEVVPCDTMRAYFAVRLRCTDVRAAITDAVVACARGWYYVVLVTACVAALRWVEGQAGPPLSLPHAFGIIAVVALLVSLLCWPFTWIYIHFLSPLIVAFVQRPTPPLARDLLCRAAAVPQGRMPKRRQLTST